MIFLLGGHQFAFPGHNIKEIVPVDGIVEVPGASANFLGVMTIRGEIESVLHLNRLFGFADINITPASRLAIATDHRVHTGIAVDAILDIADVPKNAIDMSIAALPKSVARFAVGHLSHGDMVTPLLSVEKIFQALEESGGE